MRWMKLEPIILSEVSRKNKYHVLMHIHGIQKDGTDEPICMAVSCSLSRVCLFATPWTVAYQAPLSMGFCRQEYWSGLPFPSPGDLPDPGIEPGSPALEADASPPEPPGKPIFLVAMEIQTQRTDVRTWAPGQGDAEEV